MEKYSYLRGICSCLWSTTFGDKRNTGNTILKKKVEDIQLLDRIFGKCKKKNVTATVLLHSMSSHHVSSMF